jgi:hypothetical protein
MKVELARTHLWQPLLPRATTLIDLNIRQTGEREKRRQTRKREKRGNGYEREIIPAQQRAEDEIQRRREGVDWEQTLP